MRMPPAARPRPVAATFPTPAASPLNPFSIWLSTYSSIRRSNRCSKLSPGRLLSGGNSSGRFVERQLVDVLALDVLQVLLAEVADADALRQVVADECPGRLGDEDLAAVAGRADPRGAHDVHPDIALVADVRLAGVQPHPHPYLGALRPRVGGKRALALDCPADGIPGARERVEERVALRVDLAPARGGEDVAQEPPVVGDNLAVLVAQLLEQARRAFDVREQERDGAAWKSHAVTVQSREPAGARDEPVPPPARRESGRLVPVGRGGTRPRAGRGQADSALDRLRRLPLVPRDGAGVVREPDDRRSDERALRLHQGRPGGAAGPRRDLHGRGRRDDRPRRLALDGLPHTGGRAVPGRDVLPARAAPRAAVVPAGARRRLGALARAARGRDAPDRGARRRAGAGGRRAARRASR